MENKNMTDADKKLQIFFHEIGNIEIYKNLKSHKLSDFHDECWAILKDKTYGDINVQDSDGNTHLHCLSKKCSWNWFLELLQLGADPTIVNNKGLSAFQVCPSPTAVFNFWRISSIKDLDSFLCSDWDKRTENFAPNFKQFLFDGHLLNNKHVFQTIDKALSFVDKIGLSNDLNKIKIVAVSQGIELGERINWYEERFNSPETNNEFFTKLVKVPPVSGDREHYYSCVNKFLEKEFIHNKPFNKAIVDIIEEEREGTAGEVCRTLMRMMIKKEFNLDEKIGHTDKSIMQVIEKKQWAHKIFLEEALKVNSSSKRVMKI